MLITNAHLITWSSPNQILEDHGLFITDGKIARDRAFQRADRAVSRGRTVGRPRAVRPAWQYQRPRALLQRLCLRPLGTRRGADQLAHHPGTRLWWPFDKALTAEDVRYSAWNGVIDAIRHGTTTLFDHHSSPNCIDGVLDIIAEVVEAGRAALGAVLRSHRPGWAGARQGWDRGERPFYPPLHPGEGCWGACAGHFWHPRPDDGLGRDPGGLPGGCPRGDGLPPARGRARIRPVPQPGDGRDALGGPARTTTHILGERTILAHAIHLDAREVGLIAESGSWVSHQPRNNQNAADGVAEVESYLRAGVRVCLGNDGLSNTMWREAEVRLLPAENPLSRQPAPVRRPASADGSL